VGPTHRFHILLTFLVCDAAIQDYVSRVLKRVGNSFLILALLTATNSQWFVLQSVAWASMIVCYSEKAPLKVALVHTFDGRHPCCLCKAIAAAKKSEKKKEFPLQVRKLEFPPVPEEVALLAPAQFRLLPMAHDSFAESPSLRPPTPPPRRFFAKLH
jgi:hypothetical protein